MGEHPPHPLPKRRRHVKNKFIIGIVIVLIAVIGTLAIDRAKQPARDEAACINNMRQIEAGKASICLEQGIELGEPFPPEAVSGYIKGGWDSVKCPSGGKIEVGLANPTKVGKGSELHAPSCSIHGTVR